MDLDIALWTGGTLFSLAIFAVKVGFGLGYGRSGTKIVGIVLAAYVVLFTIMAMLAGKLIGIITPILSHGPYLHILMSIGLIAWGFYTLRSAGGMAETGKVAGEQALLPSLLLIIPCPVCLTAMAFSTWSALNVIKLPPHLVGFGLGAAFAVLTLLFLFLARSSGKPEQPASALGLVMIAIGLYFVASLVIPAKIEAAKTVYASFVGKDPPVDYANTAGVLCLLIIAMIIGYFGKRREPDI